MYLSTGQCSARIFKHLKCSKAYTTTNNNLELMLFCNVKLDNPEDAIVLADVATCKQPT
jgi:hypothetical protein